VTLPAAVIFDNDGLLLDTETVWTRAEQDLFERRGREFTLAHKQKLVGTPAHINGALLEKFLDEPGKAEILMDELDELVMIELEGGVETLPGAEELLAELRERGVAVGLVSNSPRAFIEVALELVDLSRRFDVVVSGHEVAAPKPAPDPYLEACRQLRVDPSPDVVVLEDSPTGVAAGVAAGLTVIGVPSLEGMELDEAHIVVGSLQAPELRTRLGLR
jgi:HAD superfamily hydrolase (TIGR01509 family)